MKEIIMNLDWNYITNDLQSLMIHSGIIAWGMGIFYFIGMKYEAAKKRHHARKRADRAKAARMNKMV